MPPIERVLNICDVLALQFSERADQHDRDGSFPFENASDLRDAGLPALTVPTEFGGSGALLCDMVQVLQHLARGDASTALGVAMHLHIMGQQAETRSWLPEPYEALCYEVVSRRLFVNTAASEPEMGSPSRGGMPATTATPVEGGYRINGRKSWVTFAPALDYILTSATIVSETDATQRLSGVFAVAGNAQGVRIQDNWGTALSVRASGSCEIEYRDVFVPARWHVETRRQGDLPRTPPMPPAWSASAFASVYLGVGEAALAAFATYARQRIPSALGKPIAELPSVQRVIGQMDVTLRAARAVLFETARRWDVKPEWRHTMAAEFAAAKYLCTNAAVTATELAVRAAGANGLDRRLPLERFFRDARAGLMHPPQDDLALELMGRQVIHPV